MTQFKVRFIDEFNPDGEPMFFRFADECPVCHSEGALTSPYDTFEECTSVLGGLFDCEECGAKFRVASWKFGDEEGYESVIDLLEWGRVRIKEDPE